MGGIKPITSDITEEHSHDFSKIPRDQLTRLCGTEGRLVDIIINLLFNILRPGVSVGEEFSRKEFLRIISGDFSWDTKFSELIMIHMK